MSNTTIKIESPASILDEAIRKAVKKHAKALAEAIKRDLQLEQKALAIHPDAMKGKALELLARAESGDDDAHAELEKHGGPQGWAQQKSGMYGTYEGARRANAMACAPLIESLADSLVPAVEEAGEAIQKQFENVLAQLGELPPGISENGARVRNLCSAVREAARRSGIGIGPGWILEGIGLRHHIEAEAKS